MLDELGGADKPHGRLTDQASLATGDGDASERANVGQELSLLAASSAPASLAIGAPLSYRSGTANGTAWVLQLVDPGR